MRYLSSVAYFVVLTVLVLIPPPIAGQSADLDRRLLGSWRFEKYGPVTGEITFRADGTYSYSVRHGARRLAHDGTYTTRRANQPVQLRGLLGIVALTPGRVVVAGDPTSLIEDHKLPDNERPREYFVQDNLEPRYTQGIPTLSLCDTMRDWPGCAQTTRLYNQDPRYRP